MQEELTFIKRRLETLEEAVDQILKELENEKQQQNFTRSI